MTFIGAAECSEISRMNRISSSQSAGMLSCVRCSLHAPELSLSLGVEPDAAWTMRRELWDVVWVRTSRWLQTSGGAGPGVIGVCGAYR